MTHEQNEVLAFLARPEVYPWVAAGVERFTTHGAIVFLAGEFALKIKRAVRYPYMDFSTLERRHAALTRELAVNRVHAPDLYLELMAITRGVDGRLAFGGDGEAVEWGLRMRRFDQQDLLAYMAGQGPLSGAIAEQAADTIATSHAAAAVDHTVDGPGRLLRDVAQIETAFAGGDDGALAARAANLGEVVRHRIARHAPLLAARVRDGLVRRCHGDLHLANIVLWQGKPMLFDAIEFDEGIATVDVLYDLAFLLMDLMCAGQRAAANKVFARYLWRTRRLADLDGLAALPEMLALRAGIRALVSMQRGGSASAQVGSYMVAAERFLIEQPVRLVAIGGLSGTGKSTIAAALAPGFGAAPGALHLRSDLERKALAGVEPTERLAGDAYGDAANRAVYEALMQQARRALGAGHSVIVDAVFARPAERAAMAAAARSVNAAFTGLWLEAPREVLEARVGARRGDASDATVETVGLQHSYDAGAIDWVRVDASGGPDDVEAAARFAVGLEGEARQS